MSETNAEKARKIITGILKDRQLMGDVATVINKNDITAETVTTNDIAEALAFANTRITMCEELTNKVTLAINECL